MSPPIVGIIGLAFTVLLFFLRIPVAYAMALGGLVGFACLVSLEGSFAVVAKDIFYTFGSYTLTVVPLFIWMGYIAFYAGVSRRLYAAAYKSIGNTPGGLAMATQAACAAFGAMCGSVTATAATLAAISLPEMKKYKYDDSLATACVAAGAVLGIMIPPSTVFIIYGIIVEESIGKLFIAGILPGLLLMSLYMLVIYVQVRLNPSIAPPGPPTAFREKISAVVEGGAEVLVLFGLVMGGLFVGFFTPTEAGAVGVFGILVLALARRKLSWQGFITSLSDATKVTAMVFLMVAGAMILSRFIAVSRIPFLVAEWATLLPIPSSIILLIVILISLILGCFIESLPLILLLAPVFAPLVTALGYDLIWFGVIIILIAGMGLITPPVGLSVYIVSGVAKDVPLTTTFRGIWWFLGAQIVCAVILIFFPQIALFLPSLM